jgi:DNA-directed RNA polymerase specialized sigma24 family protein
MSDAKLGGIDSTQALRALFILVAADRAERSPPPRVPTDRLLREAGLSYAQIGAILDEKAGTIQKRLERGEKDSAAPKKGAKR